MSLVGPRLQRIGRHDRDDPDSAARRAALLSVGTCLILAFAWVSYWYAYFRSGAVLPSVLEYALLLFIGLGICGMPFLLLIGCAQYALNRSIALRTHIKLLVLSTSLAVIVAEGFVLKQDLLLPQPIAANTDWQHRSFPFSFRKIAYSPTRGAYVSDD